MQIRATIDTPEVSFDEKHELLAIRGRSLPEDAWSFYRPILDWAKSFNMNGSKKLTIELHLEYFNSSSSRYLLEFLSTLEKKAKDRISVIWITESDDEVMMEKGAEFDDLLEIQFTFSSV